MSTSSRLTRTAFVQIPVPLLEHCAARGRKGVLFVYGWLWHYAGKDDNAFPSIQRLALECRMKPDDVRQALRCLVEQGWVHRVDRAGRTTLFHVRLDFTGDPGLPPERDSPRQQRLPLAGEAHPSPGEAMGGFPQMGEPNKETRTTTQEKEQDPSALNTPEQPGALAREARRGRPEQLSRVLRPEDIPDDLADCAEGLSDWWAVKPRGHSRIAFDRACRLLRRYSPAERLQMLETATIGEHQGLYPPRSSSANRGGAQPISGGGSRQADNAARAIAALVAHREAASASMAPEPGRLLQAEVLP